MRRTGGKGDIGMIRLDFPGYTGADSLEHISWDDWFDKFDESGLARRFLACWPRRLYMTGLQGFGWKIGTTPDDDSNVDDHDKRGNSGKPLKSDAHLARYTG